MAELTGQRVALFLLASLLLVLVFTYTEIDTTDASTMVILHGQTSTGPKGFSLKAVDTARRTTIPNLYSYSYTSTYSKNDINLNWTYGDITDMQDMRDWEIKNITVKDEFGQSTGLFSMKQQVVSSSHMELALLVFVLLTWFFGVAAFAGPIMTLVIIPIERAVKLLSMLVMDPLGYRNTLQYKNFLLEADQIATNGRWTREVLKGMETEFLMSTIVRIGSLMKVGFGSAGVQIIRNNLQKGHSKDTGTLILNSRGTMVSCIFLFCDIRGFTDATECLQEEVFVFTNRVAAVVHSICNSYGGSANKNIGDAFLVSWKLGDSSCEPRGSSRCSHCDTASRHQADKALLSVVKICIALHHNDYYVEMMSDHAKKSLLNKLKDRPGPTVQLGFGLHAGKAVEGAIGSQRKIDATYVSEAVETSEYLETSTKKYKVQMLMSGSFHRLLQPSRRQRCRKIDQVVFENEDDEFYEEGYNQGDRMELFTYDIDVDALWDDTENNDDDDDDSLSDSDDSAVISSSTRDAHRNGLLRLSKRNGSGRSIGSSSRNSHDGTRSNSLSSRGADNQNITAAIAAAAAKAMRASPTMHTEPDERENKSSRKKKKTPELVLPTGPALYSENIWLQADMRRIRRRYTTDIFDTFNVGLQKYYSKDWNEAKVRFEAILDRFEDGPSKYFLDEMSKHDGIPPPNFQAFDKA